MEYVDALQSSSWRRPSVLPCARWLLSPCLSLFLGAGEPGWGRTTRITLNCNQRASFTCRCCHQLTRTERPFASARSTVPSGCPCVVGSLGCKCAPSLQRNPRFPVGGGSGREGRSNCLSDQAKQPRSRIASRRSWPTFLAAGYGQAQPFDLSALKRWKRC